MSKSKNRFLFTLFFVITSFIVISFTPVTAADVIMDETVTVEAYSHRVYSFKTNYDDVELIVEVEVLTGNDITVFVTDQTNYMIWINGGSATGYLNKERTGSFTEDVTLGPEGTYYIILFNMYSSDDKSVYVFIEAGLPPGSWIVPPEPAGMVSTNPNTIFRSGVVINGLLYGGVALIASIKLAIPPDDI